MSQPIPDSQVEVVSNSVWIYRQSWNGKPTPYWYARIVLPEYVESRSHRNQVIRKSTKKTDQTEAEIWARDKFHEMCGNQRLGMPADSKTFAWMFSDYQRVQELKVHAGEVSEHRFKFNEETYRNYLKPFFADMDIRRIDHEKLLSYKSARFYQLRVVEFCEKTNSLRTFFRHCAADGVRRELGETDYDTPQQANLGLMF